MATTVPTNVSTNVFCERVPLTFFANVSTNVKKGFLAEEPLRVSLCPLQTFSGVHPACVVTKLFVGGEATKRKKTHG